MGRDLRGWGVVAGMTVVVLLLDALRVFLPSIIFVFGRAGSTPATTMGAFAVGWFAAGMLALPIARLFGARRVGIGSAVAFLVARLSLLATDGGDPQLYLAGASFVLATWTLVSVALSATDRWPAIGAVLGLPAAVLVHLGLGTVDPQWQDGVAGWVIIALLAGGLVLGTLGLHADNPDSEAEDSSNAHRDDMAPAGSGLWWRLGPALLLMAIVGGVPAWTETPATSLLPNMGAALFGAPGLVVAALAGALAGLAWNPERFGTNSLSTSRAWAIGAALSLALLLGLAATLTGDGLGARLGPLLVAVTAPILLFIHGGPRPDRPGRPSVAAGSAALLMGVVGFLYYAGYDMNLGDNRIILLVTGVLLVTWRPPSVAPGPLARGRRWTASERLAVAGPLVVLLILLALAAPSSPSPSPAGPVDELRVAVANIHMGWDTEGRFAIEHIGDELEALGADIIVLNEVDRGWLLTGGHDTLALLSERLDLPWVFAPAADRVWGNAILSRFPLDQVAVTELPQAGVPMRRSAIVAEVQLPDRALTIVGTHLHHVEDDDSVRRTQAAAVADLVDPYVHGMVPTVLLGDLNAPPGDPALASLTNRLDDAIAPADPLYTFPAWAPDERIDHILASPGVTVSEITRGGSSDSSDHLWLAVTIGLA